MAVETDVAPQETKVQETSVETQETPKAEETDPFAVDESQFVSLSPEQRAALDPVLGKWKESAKTYAQKERESEAQKYTEHVKKAQALETLARNPKFIEWYNQQTNPQKAQDTAPKTVASAEEWANALQALANGDSLAYEQLQQKLVMSVGAPAMQDINYMKAESELNRVISVHPDVRDLDMIGRETDPNAPSLFQLCLEQVKERRGGTVEQAYQLAKSIAGSMETRGKRTAMGMVNGKMNSTTEPQVKNNSKDEGVMYVDTLEEAMSKNIEAAIDGRKIKYSVKK